MEDRQTKGEIAQLKTELRALEKGIVLSKPTSPSSRYDYIIDDNGKLLRAQVKYADGHDKRINGVAIVGLRKIHKTSQGNKIVFYQPDEIDVLLVYVPKVDKVLLFSGEKIFNKSAIHIRFEAAKNNQSNTNWYEDFIW